MIDKLSYYAIRHAFEEGESIFESSPDLLIKDILIELYNVDVNKYEIDFDNLETFPPQWDLSDDQYTDLTWNSVPINGVMYDITASWVDATYEFSSIWASKMDDENEEAEEHITLVGK